MRQALRVAASDRCPWKNLSSRESWTGDLAANSTSSAGAICSAAKRLWKDRSPSSMPGGGGRADGLSGGAQMKLRHLEWLVVFALACGHSSDEVGYVNAVVQTLTASAQIT